MESKQIYTIPASLNERSRLRSLIEAFVDRLAYIPPVSMDDLSDIADRIIDGQLLDPGIKGWIMVEVNNCVWRDTVASIPYDKRILLLPQCLRHSSKCQAEIDELGLLCHQCSSCTIPDLQEKADRLGMMSVVAEGFTAVVGLIENKVVDTVIGVSCLESLEKAFPLLVNNAVPGLAIPLNMNGCKDTDVDYGYVNRMISMLTDTPANLLDYDYLKTILKAWFSKDTLANTLSPANHQTAAIALDWMGSDGKRWRPYLLTATYLALSGEKEAPEAVRLAAVAVECFHKASLVHDDIQDNDTLRYGRQTVNAAHGIPIAINVGDVLLGEGYRLLAASGNSELITAAADAHIALCKGQGMELEWSASPRLLDMDFVLDIFCHKTVPAFEVSLVIGLICGDGQSFREPIHTYSRALGIAYQLQDDIEDFETDEPLALRPSSILAAICKQQPDPLFVHELLHTGDLNAFLKQPENKPLLQAATARVKQMADQYHRSALEALHSIDNRELKRLLFRVTQRILK